MKIVRFLAGNRTGYGVLNGEVVQAIGGKPFGSIRLTGLQYRPDVYRRYRRGENRTDRGVAELCHRGRPLVVLQLANFGLKSNYRNKLKEGRL